MSRKPFDLSYPLSARDIENLNTMLDSLFRGGTTGATGPVGPAGADGAVGPPGPNEDLDDLLNVDTAGKAGGDKLAWDDAAGKWVPVSDSSVVSGGGPAAPDVSSVILTEIASPGAHLGTDAHAARQYWVRLWSKNALGVEGPMSEPVGPIVISGDDKALQVDWDASADPEAASYCCGLSWSWYGIRVTQIIDTAGLTATFTLQTEWMAGYEYTLADITPGARLPTSLPPEEGEATGDYARLGAENLFTRDNAIDRHQAYDEDATVDTTALAVARTVAVDPPPGGGGITWDTPAVLEDAGGGHVTSTVACTVNAADAILVVVVGNWGAPTAVTGITYNGVALTQLTSRSGSGYQSDIWYLKNPDVGTFNVVVTFAAGTSEVLVTATPYYGADLAGTTWGAPQTDNSSGGPNPMTYTYATAAGDVVIEGRYGRTANAPASQTTVGSHVAGASDSAYSTQQVAAGASTVTSWDNPSAWAWTGYCGCVLKMAAAPPDPTVAVTGPVVRVSSDSGGGALDPTDSAPVVELEQEYASATGPVLSILNAGSGKAIDAEGDAEFTGDVTAAGFSGDGAGLTGVDADTVDGKHAADLAQLAAGSNAFAGTLSERGRSTPIGEYIAADHAADKFAGSGAMTVVHGTIYNYSYTLIGKTMILHVVLGATLGGVASNVVKVKIPDGFVAHASRYFNASIMGVDGDGANLVGAFAQVNPGETWVWFYKDNSTPNWALGAGCYLQGQIAFEVQ